MNKTFSETLEEMISGRTLKEIAEAIDIPYRTIQNWKLGTAVPSKITQKAVIEQISEYLNK